MNDKDKDDTSRPSDGYDPGEWGGGGGGGGQQSQGQPENLLQGSGGFVERQGKFWSRFAFWSRDDDGGWNDLDEQLEPEEETDDEPSDDDSDENEDKDHPTEGVVHSYDPGPPPAGD